MKQPAIKYTEYKNGFVVKMRNRRIQVLRDEGETDWLLIFRNFHGGLLTKKEKKNYTGSFDRFNRTVTDKLLRLSDEALRALVELSFIYLKNNQ